MTDARDESSSEPASEASASAEPSGTAEPADHLDLDPDRSERWVGPQGVVALVGSVVVLVAAVALLVWFLLGVVLPLVIVVQPHPASLASFVLIRTGFLS